MAEPCASAACHSLTYSIQNCTRKRCKVAECYVGPWAQGEHGSGSGGSEGTTSPLPQVYQLLLHKTPDGKLVPYGALANLTQVSMAHILSRLHIVCCPEHAFDKVFSCPYLSVAWYGWLFGSQLNAALTAEHVLHCSWRLCGMQVPNASPFLSGPQPAVKQLAFEEAAPAMAELGLSTAHVPFMEVSPQSMPATALLASPNSTPSATPQFLGAQF